MLVPFIEVGESVKEIDMGVREIENNAFDLLDLRCLLDTEWKYQESSLRIAISHKRVECKTLAFQIRGKYPIILSYFLCFDWQAQQGPFLRLIQSS